MNFRSILVSKTGSVLVFVISAGLAQLLSFCAANFPWLHAEEIVNAMGGQLVVTLLLMGLLREGMAWVIRHWASVNIEAVKVVQEAINAELGRGTLKPDGMLQQKTGAALNVLFRGEIPIEKLPKKSKTKVEAIAGMFMVIALVPILLSSCAGPDGVAHVSAMVPIPIPADQPEKQWRIKFDLGIYPPPNLSLPVLDSPIHFGLSKD